MILKDFLSCNKNLQLEEGTHTPGDGNCFLWACIQNMVELQRRGQWSRPIPAVNELRAQVIQFMIENRKYWTRPRFNTEIERMQDAPLEDDSFQELLLDQQRQNAWTDNMGVFVEALSLFLDVQIDIIKPDVEGPILPSGLGGPYLSVNKSEVQQKTIFYFGLYNQHYQFLKKRIPAVSRTLSNSPSPLKIKRSNIISKYLKSPIKKNLFKNGHCTFCSTDTETGIQLEEHLEKSPRCHKYYLRNFKSKNILPIILKEFNCLYCNHGSSKKIVLHLKKSDDCRNKYFQKFNTSSVKDLQYELSKIIRQLRPSAVNRKEELERRRVKRLDDDNNKTESDLINDFRKETSFANPLLCHQCGANYSFKSSRISEVKLDSDEVDGAKIMSRRFERFYCCTENRCFKLDSSNMEETLKLEDENNILFAPNIGSHNNDIEIEDSATAKNITCLLPCTAQCLEILEMKNKSFFQGIKSRQQSVGLVYCVNPDLRKLIPLIYENEASKYKALKDFGERYEATIVDNSKRILKNAQQVINDSNVVASDSWRRKQVNDHFSRLNQLGSIFIHLNIQLSRESDDVIATVLVQEGKVVTVDYFGDPTNIMKTNYNVHDHNCDSECGSSCRTVLLKDYLSDSNFDCALIGTRYLSTYASSIQMKFNSLLRNFVKAPSSPLYSEHYQADISFEMDNRADIDAQLWPTSLHEINLQIGEGRTYFGTAEKEKLIQHVDTILIASCDKETLMQRLKISNEEGMTLVQLIKEKQFHRCSGPKICHLCEDPNYPILTTSILEWSPNFLSCQELNKWVKSQIKLLSEHQIANLSTEEWLLQLFSFGEVSVVDSKDGYLLLEFNGKKITFPIDERMNWIIAQFQQSHFNQDAALFVSLYHYSVSTVSVDDIGGVIVKRTHLKDIFVSEFNVSLLKAVQAKVKLKVLNGNGSKSYFEKSVKHWGENVDQDIWSTHQEVSLLEAFVLFDKNFPRRAASNPVEYVYTMKDRKTFFKKVKTTSESSFKIENSNKVFEKLMTNVERFFLRCKKELKLCLCEFIQNYDFVGEEESRNLFKLFTRHDIEIKDSDRRSAFSGDVFLPEILILENGDVMKLRSNTKIIAYQDCEENSPEYFFQQVLLFSPDVKQEMSNVEVNIQFGAEDETCDETGNIITVIQRIKRYELELNCN